MKCELCNQKLYQLNPSWNCPTTLEGISRHSDRKILYPHFKIDNFNDSNITDFQLIIKYPYLIRIYFPIESNNYELIAWKYNWKDEKTFYLAEKTKLFDLLLPEKPNLTHFFNNINSYIAFK